MLLMLQAHVALILKSSHPSIFGAHRHHQHHPHHHHQHVILPFHPLHIQYRSN